MPQVDFSQAGASVQPSPSIWDNCPLGEFNEEGTGFYIHEDFIGGTEVWADGGPVGNFPFATDGDASSTIAKRTGGVGGLQDMAVSGTDNNAVAIFSQPLGKIVRNSGNELWFEARYNPVAITEDRGVFFGFTAEAGMSRDVLADDVASVAAGLISNDLLGFTQQTDNKDDVQAVVRVGTGTPVVILADATNASALTAPAHLVAGTYRKIGFKFDGKDQITIYIDGQKAYARTLLAAEFPTTNLALIAAVKTGAAATATINFDWIRAAVRTRR